jgi:hypothetical protein
MKDVHHKDTKNTKKNEGRTLLCFLSSLCSLCLCGDPAFADPPAATYLFPAGGQRGNTVKFHAAGLNLNQSCSLEMIGSGVQASPIVTRTNSPWFEGPLLPLPESQRQEDYPRAMAATVNIAGNAIPGDRYILLRTAQGITTPLRFVVGTLPEIVEDEVEGEPVPVSVAAPVTINGRIFPHEDVDIWAVKLRKGETLTARVDAARIGSPLEAKLDVRDPAGKPVSEAFASPGKDPVLRFTAPTEGVYNVSITDARADGGPAFVYRLSLTTGTDSSTDAAPESARTDVRETDAPDPIRGNYLAVPAVGAGCITSPGEVDRWGFSAQRGELFDIELRPTPHESRLLGVLIVTDSAGKELARAEPGTAPNIYPAIRLTAASDGLFFVTVQDRFRNRGGAEFNYRLRLARPGAGFDLTFATLSQTVARGQSANVKVTARRHGSFIGPIRLSLEGLRDGLKAPTEVVLQPGQTAIDIPLKADQTAKVQPSLFCIRGTALISAGPFASVRMRATQYATWGEDSSVTEVRLAVAVPTPFKISGDYELKLIPRGTTYTRRYRIERNGFPGPIEIDLADKQARHLQGVSGPKFVVPADKSEFDYPITLPPWMEMGRTCRVCVMGSATVKDADETEHVVTYSSREQNDQIIAVVEPERLGLRLDRPTILVEPGKTTEVRVEVRRGEGLKGDATVELVLPKVKGVSGESVKIAGDSGVLKLVFGPDARGPFTMPLTVRATVMDGTKPVTAERKLELVVPR